MIPNQHGEPIEAQDPSMSSGTTTLRTPGAQPSPARAGERDPPVALHDGEDATIVEDGSGSIAAGASRRLQFWVEDVLGYDPVSARKLYGQKIRAHRRRNPAWPDGVASGGGVDWDSFHDLWDGMEDVRERELMSGTLLAATDGYLLHAACASAAPPDVVEALLRATPPRVLEHRSGPVTMGATPLHLACFFRSPSGSIKLLLTASSSALHAPDAFGRLPIHVACLRGSAVDSAEGVRLLMGADPDLATLGARDSHGSTPLQLASQFSRSEVVEAILAAYIEADRSGHKTATVSEVRRQLPLHKALQRYPSDMPINVVGTFAVGTLSSSTALLTTKDRRGRLPLHLACQYGAGKAVFDDLINNDSTGGTFVTSDDSQQTPADLLVALILSDEPRSLRTLQDIADADHSRRFFGAVDSHRRTMLDRMLKSISAADAGRGLTRLQRDALLCLVACTPPGFGRYAVSVQRCRDALGARAFYRLYKDPRLHRTLNNLMCKRSFTFYFMLDLYVRILLVTFYTLCSNYLIDGVWLSPAYYVSLYLCCAYLLLWQVRLAWSHQLYYLGEFWNLLDFLTNFLVILSVGLLQAGKRNDGGYRILNVVVGGLVWFVIVAAALRSTFKHFSVFLSGLTMILAYMVAFGVCLLLLLGSFAEMYYKSMTGRASCSLDQDPREFCNYGASFLKVYAMFVGGIDPTLLTVDTEPNLLVLTIFYGFLFAIVMLNVLVAVIFDAWGRVSPDGERIYFQYRHMFLTEAADLRLFTYENSAFEGMDHTMNSVLLRFRHRPKEFGTSTGALGKVAVVIKYCMDATILCFLFFAGLLTAGTLWPIAFRRFIFSIGTQDEEAWDTPQPDESQGRSPEVRIGQTFDYRETLDVIQEHLASLRSDVNDLVDATHDIHTDVWKLMENVGPNSQDR